MTTRFPRPTCPACGQRAAERTDLQEIEGGPYSADPNQREIVQVFQCRCGASFATSELAPLEEMAA
jgi:hypothetical protein